MWDTQPILYWRVKKNGKWTWQKAKAAMTQMGLYAIEPPVYRGDESE
jgi:hypothetical protein